MSLMTLMRCFGIAAWLSFVTGGITLITAYIHGHWLIGLGLCGLGVVFGVMMVAAIPGNYREKDDNKIVTKIERILAHPLTFIIIMASAVILERVRSAHP